MVASTVNYGHNARHELITFSPAESYRTFPHLTSSNFGFVVLCYNSYNMTRTQADFHTVSTPTIPQKPVAIVTGATRGIGKATAMLLHRKGYHVVGVYKKSDELASSLVELGIDMVKADVGVQADVQKVMRNVAQKYGRLDVVVNNAGIDIFGRIEDYPVDGWNTMLATNLTSAFLFAHSAIPYLKQSPVAAIVNVSSRVGIAEFAEPEFVVYGTVKAALNFFTIGLAKELSDTNIRVNAVIPPPTKTDLFDEVFTPEDEQELKENGKLGTPSEVAQLIWETIEDRKINGELVFDSRITREADYR